MYTPNGDEDIGVDLFPPKGLNMDALSLGMANLTAEDADDIVAKLGDGVLQGHNLLKTTSAVQSNGPA